MGHKVSWLHPVVLLTTFRGFDSSMSYSLARLSNTKMDTEVQQYKTYKHGVVAQLAEARHLKSLK